VSLHWHHAAWASSLCNGHGVCLGDVYRDDLGSWGTYGQAGDGNAGQVHLGHYPTRAAAMRAVASACDPKKFPSPRK
jgi:hypothetical protein